MRPIISLSSLLLALASSLSLTAQALDPFNPDLFKDLALHPELMNVEYLQYFLGRPDENRGQIGGRSKSYAWYADRSQLQYQLEQQEARPGQVTESMFTMHMPDSPMTFKNVEKVYGQKGNRFYDYQGHPSESFSLAPNTQLVFSGPQNSFRILKARVHYRGPGLPPVSANDMGLARNSLMNRAMVFVDEEDVTRAMPLLTLRLQENPRDGEALYELGRIYGRQGRLHDAINHFKAALDSSGTNDELRKNCALRLHELRVVTVDGVDDTEHRQLDIVGKGQRIKAKGKSKNQPENTQKNQVVN